MIRVVMDTSALISLELIGLLGKSLKIVEIIIPEVVKEELEELSEYDDKEGKSAKKILKLINVRKIRIVKIKNKKKAKEILSKNVDLGESECIVSCIENKIKTLIMDDISAAYEFEGLAVSNGIDIKISIALLIELHKKEMIDDKQLLRYVKKLIKTRDWEGGVLEILAKKYLYQF